MKNKVLIQIILCFIIMNYTLIAQDQQVKNNNEPTSVRSLPIGSKWAIDKGIDLPKPFGVSAFFIYMKRDIKVTNVDVTLPGKQAQSINDFASFGVSNQTVVTAMRFDTWVLPLMNVYVLGGYTFTNTSLDATFTIDRIILPKPPIVIETIQKSQVGGPYFGVGTTLVGGYGPWFILA